MSRTGSKDIPWISGFAIFRSGKKGIAIVIAAVLLLGAAGCAMVDVPSLCTKKGWGYEVRIEADRADLSSIKEIIYSLTSRGFNVDWHEDVVELRYKGEVNTALYKEFGDGEHSFVNVMIYYVNASTGGTVNYPKIDVSNPYRGSADTSIKTEIDSYGDMISHSLERSAGAGKVRVERNLLDPPMCL